MRVVVYSIGIAFGAILVVIGLVVALTGAGLVLGILLIAGGGALGAASLGAWQVHDVYIAAREWKDLLLTGGGPDELRVVAFEPPKGFLFRREATVHMEVSRAGAPPKEIQRGVPVPIPQAFLWRLTGRIPTPIGRLTDRRELDLAIKRGRQQAGSE